MGTSLIQKQLGLNPTKVAHVLKVADSGNIMLHKSTFFYPKVLTGLLIRKLDEAVRGFRPSHDKAATGGRPCLSRKHIISEEHIMASLSIQSVDEQLAALLKQQAAAARKSVSQFVLDTLRQPDGGHAAAGAGRAQRAG
ncbi:MAG: Protein of unknown function (DUF1015) [Candidatus Electronema aureum]|uniref:Uncharacterized protein n=1 Tax=Candidatus Electronema aureum TaxID=2005002 RepID=A0A521G4M3_9BACT|nr:MAG: Protein of unknown function (DUF1015) [Candidatus Electronema aureum]